MFTSLCVCWLFYLYPLLGVRRLFFFARARTRAHIFHCTPSLDPHTQKNKKNPQVVITVITAFAASTSTSGDLYVIPTGLNSLTAGSPGLLGNDPAATAVVGRRLQLLVTPSLNIPTPPRYGNVALGADGSLVYTPHTPITGSMRDTFEYTVRCCVWGACSWPARLPWKQQQQQQHAFFSGAPCPHPHAHPRALTPTHNNK